MLSFVIPVRNDAERLRRCLASIRANAYPPDKLEVLVADNGSSDDSAHVARQDGASVLTLPGLRVGALRNAAAREAHGDLLAFVDADNEIEPSWAASAAAALQFDTSAAAVGSAYLPPPDATDVQRAYDLLRARSPVARDAEWLGSGNLVVRREVFAALDGFDTRLEACEDVDFCRRLRAAGHRLIEDPRLRNAHHGDPASLAAVFRGELWRGRDNARVSLRAPRSWRTLASFGTAIAGLGALLLMVLGALVFVRLGVFPAVVGFVAFTLLIGSRAFVMVRRGSMRAAPVPIGSVLAVAGAYEAGRALALVLQMPHGLRAGRSRLRTP